MMTGIVLETAMLNKKTYLSCQDVKTTVDREFRISEGGNSGFWTTIPVPSNWETEDFGNELYARAKIEQRAVAYYRYCFSNLCEFLLK